jgi:peptidoglycan hydrolase-like protein with peptidoglycan-binding domain
LIKTKLISLNYYEGEKNDIYDNELEKSVVKFQEDMGIEPNGKIGPLTFYTIIRSKDYSFKRVLELIDPIMEGPDIEIVQEMLFRKGYLVDINGFYDVKTYKAVCQFQLDNNFIVDGKVDLELFQEILS